MAGLKIEAAKCTGCGICVKTCAFNALCVEDKKARVDEKCVLCGICVDGCPFGAISIEKESGKERATFAKYSGVWVFAETNSGELARVSLELVAKGREVADERGCALTAVLGGENTGKNSEILFAHGADRVIFCRDSRLAGNEDAPYTEYLARLIEKYRPEIFLFGATKFGRSLAPRVAARIKTGLTADCTGLDIDPETKLLRQTRPAFGGNLMATIICPDARPQMATVRPGVMPTHALNHKRQGELIEEKISFGADERVRLLEVIKTEAAKSIADAKTLVVAGRGIGNQKNLTVVKEFAELIGAELGCSRPLVDMGWCEYRHQVGQTGCSVAPQLLISVGVSGAIQHLAGISRAENIVAINSDPDAPIFGVSRYAVHGDCIEVLKELTAALKKSAPAT